MVLPFVRDLFADVEKLPAFLRVTSHLRANAGRIRVSGINSPAKALLIAKLQKALDRRLGVLVRNNEAADELVPVMQACCELIGGARQERRVCLPASG